MGLPMGRGSGRDRTVFVYEHVTGGGLIGQELPASWAAEGAAMRRVIAQDFAAVPGVRVVTTLDARLSAEKVPGVEIRRVVEGYLRWFESLATEADYTLVIAPESNSCLVRSTGFLERLEIRGLGSGIFGVGLAGDKFRLARHFAKCEIPTPPTWTLEQRLFDLPGWSGPVVVKPRHGAGSVDTVIVRDQQFPPWARPRRDFVAQPYVEGAPMSASVLVDSAGGVTLLGVGRQRIEVDEAGRVAYRGGTILPPSATCPADVLRAVDSLVVGRREPLVQGFVGVDFVLDDRGEATVLEINPRPTTSYVALAHLYGPGTIAGAWLVAIEGGLAGTDWPERLRASRRAGPLAFDADGTIHCHEDPSR